MSCAALSSMVSCSLGAMCRVCRPLHFCQLHGDNLAVRSCDLCRSDGGESAGASSSQCALASPVVPRSITCALLLCFWTACAC